MPDVDELRKLAMWYRELAERTGNPAIWEMRLRTAEKLEAEATRIEANLVTCTYMKSKSEYKTAREFIKPATM